MKEFIRFCSLVVIGMLILLASITWLQEKK
jgi:hypothetical protein